VSVTQADLNAARDDILSKVNDRFAGLSKLINPAPDPDPGPTPTPAGQKIRFAAHRYYQSGPIVPADFYDLQDSQYLDLSKFAGGETYRYATTAYRAGSPVDQLMDPAAMTEDDLAHTSVSRTVNNRFKRANGDVLLNLTNSNTISKIVNYQQQLMLNRGFTGVYVDEVDKQSYGYSGRYPNEFPNEAAWQTAHVNLVNKLEASLWQVGKKLWINLGGATSAQDPWIQPLRGKLFSANNEFFVAREGVGMAPAVGAEWDTYVRFLSDMERLGVPIHAHASTATQSLVDYAFVSWVLGTEFLGSFTASPDYAGGFIRPSAGLLSAVESRLPATGTYVQAANGTRYRTFTDRRLTVNPQTTAIAGVPSKGWVFTS
jgi:hypothetical protein